jgi:tRNA G18 (ribose-2'-O)-methylase SpoU
VRRLLESHFEVVSLLLPEKWLREFGPLLDQRPEPEIHAFTADKPLLEQLAGFTMYQGVLAVGRIPRPPTVQELIARAAPPRLIVAVESLTNAENLGALVRNCAAFGVQALLVGETCASPFLRRAVRGSMGGIFHVPALEVVSLVETLRELGRQGIRCVAAHPHASGGLLPGVWQRGLRPVRPGAGGMRHRRGHSHVERGGLAQRGQRRRDLPLRNVATA